MSLDSDLGSVIAASVVYGKYKSARLPVVDAIRYRIACDPFLQLINLQPSTLSYPQIHTRANLARGINLLSSVALIYKKTLLLILPSPSTSLVCWLLEISVEKQTRVIDDLGVFW